MSKHKPQSSTSTLTDSETASAPGRPPVDNSAAVLPDLSKTIIAPLQQFAVPIESLTPDPRNARKHSRKNLDAIKGSLQKFKQYQPLVVQRDGWIVRAGNGRLQAAKELGWTHVAVMIVDTESEAEAISLAIADNWTSDTADWDIETLLDEITKLKGTEFEVVGFSDEDFDKLTAEADALTAEFEKSGMDTSSSFGANDSDSDQDSDSGGPGDSGYGGDAPDSSGGTGIILHYDIVFNSAEERERFGALLQSLKLRYPNHENTAARLDAWICENEGL